MRLERLEINGFKSFSDRSELAFDKGVTAIVGPNGCGKSNVADAITWVMGEQSAKSLRGERMEDVIFNGSDARKPTATAEVTAAVQRRPEEVSGPAPRTMPGVGGPANGTATARRATAGATAYGTATAIRGTGRVRVRPAPAVGRADSDPSRARSKSRDGCIARAKANT